MECLPTPGPARRRGLHVRSARVWGSIALIGLAFASGQVKAGPPAQGVPSTRVEVVGAVAAPMDFDVAALRAFPAEQIVTLSLPRSGEGGGDAVSSVRGVRLRALVDRAQRVEAQRNDWKHTAVIARATDGYAVAFSWPELSNTEVGDQVLVVFERDGKPLEAGEGSIALVSGRDLRTGPRHVRWLSTLEVRLL